MRILNFGSLNLDRVYKVDHFVQAGETLLSGEYAVNIGGKGLNQSIALAKAGAHVTHAGAIGPDGMAMKAALEEAGVDTSHLMHVQEASGHAIIQVANGENCIIVYGGANRKIHPSYVLEILSGFGEGDLLLVQNEISCVPYIMEQAKARGMKIAVNASPVTRDMLEYPLELADYIIVNELEGAALAESAEAVPAENVAEETLGVSYEEILMRVAGKYRTAVLLTAGDKGAYYWDGKKQYYQPVVKADAVDTTGAGDTFCGYFLAGLSERMEPEEILQMAATASAITVSRPGASKSIPWRSEVDRAIISAG